MFDKLYHVSILTSAYTLLPTSTGTLPSTADISLWLATDNASCLTIADYSTLLPTAPCLTLNTLPITSTHLGFLTHLTRKTLTPNWENPYPECGCGFLLGRGVGEPKIPQGYP